MLVKAYAKINLVLDVLGTRDDGYHELETVMQTLELHDTIQLAPAPGITLQVEGAELPAGPGNLAYRAAFLLRERTGCRKGVVIRLQKRIPLAAGLAGGSADAAAVLRGLNRLWRLDLDEHRLGELAAEIGSDVPFCLRGGTALCRGRGEIVIPLPPLPQTCVVLVKPSFGVGTAEVYRRYDHLAAPRRPDCDTMLAAVRRSDIAGVAAHLGNALEQVTLGMHPELAVIKEELAATGALGTLMSGSGPTVFGLYADYQVAARAAEKMNRGANWVAATTFSPASN